MKKILGFAVGIALVALPAISFADSNVIVTTGIGATISPGGSVFIISGATQKFLAGAERGYVLSDVSVDGVSLGAVKSVDITGDNADHTVSASAVLGMSDGFVFDSSPLAPGWSDINHPNYIHYNGTTCLFNQGCMLPAVR